MDSTRAQDFVRPGAQARDERRVMCRALTFWELQRCDSRLPHSDGFDPFVVHDLMPHIYMVRLANRVANSDFTFCGSVLATACGDDLTGRNAACIHTSLNERMVDFFQSAVRYRQPLADSGSVFANGREILYRNVVMPLGDDADCVVAIYGAFNFKVDA